MRRGEMEQKREKRVGKKKKRDHFRVAQHVASVFITNFKLVHKRIDKIHA